MNAVDLIASQLARNLEFLKMTIADFSDADLLVRPAPGANHPLWQLGHLASSETMIMNQIRPGAMPALPAGFSERFSNKNNGSDDPAHFATGKKELIELLSKARQATIAAVRTMSPQDLDQPSPQRFAGIAPTVGDLLMLLINHAAMHAGQIQVARRKLGKPVLF